MVTEVKQVEATLLAQQDNDGAASPIQAVSETLPRSGRGSSWSERWGGWGEDPSSWTISGPILLICKMGTREVASMDSLVPRTEVIT